MRVAIFPSCTNEATYVAKTVGKVIQRDNDSARGGAGKHNPLSVAVLYRTSAMSRAIEEALTRRGIAYNVVGG